jgi:DNA-directed RNA polymerase subunit RPC12/RpoP
VANAPPPTNVEAEDVAELDVFFVCGECGTELRVEKIAELQVPRHCGERMLVERRPRTSPELN